MSPRHRAKPSRTLGALPPALQPVAAAAAALGLLAVALGGLSWTRPAMAATGTGVSSSIEFSYTATVPPSAAYDSTTVTAPQPVFRALTDTIDVTYAYAGRPGTIAVDAELSTASGWRSTLHLADPQPLAAAQNGSVRLRLSDLEHRARAAAAVTGIPAGSVTIKVLPKVTMDDGAEFAPEALLTLDDLALKPSGDDALTSSTTTGSGQAPAQLAALGRSIDVATARKVSVAALTLAALLAAALVALSRLSGPVTEADRIRQRHKHLLLPVLPVALTAGRPVVDVADVEHLVRLAERYGLLVLHWERSGVTTYAVQDEGTTYRYRSGVQREVFEPLGV